MKRKSSKVYIQEDVRWLVNKGFFINWHERNNASLKWNFWHPFVDMMHKSSQKIVPREYGNIIYILKLLNDDYTIDQVHFRTLVLLIHTWNFIYPCYSTMPPITQKKSNPIQTGWCAIINLSFWKNCLQEMNYAYVHRKNVR